MNTKKLDERVRDLISRNRKVEAVKLVHDTKGWGLRRSKDYVDDLAHTAQPTLSPAAEAEMAQEVHVLIHQNRPIMAIKRVRERTGWGLRESKEYVDSLEKA